VPTDRAIDAVEDRCSAQTIQVPPSLGDDGEGVTSQHGRGRGLLKLTPARASATRGRVEAPASSDVPDTEGGQVDAHHGELAMDPALAPGRVLHGQAGDELPGLGPGVGPSRGSACRTCHLAAEGGHLVTEHDTTLARSSASEHRSIGASEHRSIGASEHRSIGASEHRSIGDGGLKGSKEDENKERKTG
jgi:hypothetical protein